MAKTLPYSSVSARISAIPGARSGATTVLQIARYDPDGLRCLKIVVSRFESGSRHWGKRLHGGGAQQAPPRGTLNALAAALLPNWTAQWVWAERLEVPLFPSSDWLITDKTLAIELGDMRASFRDDGRRFKDKRATEVPLPTVDDSAELLGDSNVLAASFRTPVDEIAMRFRAAAGETLYERAVTLLQPAERRTMRVDAVTTLVPGRDDVAEIDLDKKPTPITLLIRLTVDYFSSAGCEYADVEHFLRTGRHPDPPREADAGSAA